MIERLLTQDFLEKLGAFLGLAISLVVLLVLKGSLVVNSLMASLYVVFLAFGFLAMLIFGVMCLYAVAIAANAEHESQTKRAAAIHDSRADLRQPLRRFFAEVEDGYGWLRYFSVPAARLHALRHFDQFVAETQAQNTRFQHLRADDRYEATLRDLGRPGRYSLALVKRRQQLFLWAISRTTPEQRAQAIFIEERNLQQLRIHERELANQFEHGTVAKSETAGTRESTSRSGGWS